MSDTSDLIYQNCPFDYCLPEELNLNLSNPDAQCAFNRTGILCGACPEGLSVTFGGSQCLACSNSYLALIIPFAAAGLCLVFLLFVCNPLTVATGNLNGLIFYANIVQYNRLILFPHGGHTNPLTVFILWVNLDVGFHTCFYNGMDTYMKTWLQFVFPVYVWIILAVIILASHYSSWIAKIAGEHVVSVLATLIILSFAKILRTSLFILSPAIIKHNHPKSNTAWLYDANIEYFTDKRIPLIMTAVFFIFLALLFILLLTFAPLLLTFSSHHPFKWVNRLKPFLDAYQGPYKDKHRHWTGVLLVIRGLLCLIYSIILHESEKILLVTILVSFLLVAYGWCSGGVYKKWFVNALELSFYLNLGFLASASLYVRYAGGSQAGVIYTSTSIALVEFVGVTVYGFILRLAVKCMKRWHTFKDSRDVAHSRTHVNSQPHAISTGDISMVSMSEVNSN